MLNIKLLETQSESLYKLQGAACYATVKASRALANLAWVGLWIFWVTICSFYQDVELTANVGVRLDIHVSKRIIFKGIKHTLEEPIFYNIFRSGFIISFRPLFKFTFSSTLVSLQCSYE